MVGTLNKILAMTLSVKIIKILKEILEDLPITSLVNKIVFLLQKSQNKQGDLESIGYIFGKIKLLCKALPKLLKTLDEGLSNIR
jgi:hypothetical protein